jgi:hypothetical protein
MRAPPLAFRIAFAAALAFPCAAGAATLTRDDVSLSYQPSMVSAASVGGVPATLVGVPFEGADPAAVAAAVPVPGWLPTRRLAPGATGGYRVVLVFNPAAPVTADRLCTAPADVPLGAAQATFTVQAAWCFYDVAVSRVFAEGSSVASVQDDAFASTMGELMAALLPARPKVNISAPGQ